MEMSVSAGEIAGRIALAKAGASAPAASNVIFSSARAAKGECCNPAVGSKAWAYLKKRVKQLGLTEAG
jgi:hypothetical protein